MSAAALASSPSSARSHGLYLDLCEVADIAVVGRAVQKRSFWQEQRSEVQPLPPRIVTEFQFENIASYLGELPKSFSQVFAGGEVDGEGSSVSGSPDVDVGERWFFVFQVLPTTGERRALIARLVPPDFQLPPPRPIRRAWRDACAAYPEGIFVFDRIRIVDNRVVVEHDVDPETM